MVKAWFGYQWAVPIGSVTTQSLNIQFNHSIPAREGKIKMSKNSVLKVSSLGLVELEGSPVEESENPDEPEVSGDASRINRDDLGSDDDFKSSSFIVSPQDPIVKSNRINFAEFKLSQDFDSMAGVDKITSTILVDKPQGDVFFRVRSGIEWHPKVFLLVSTEDRETYLIHPEVRQYVPRLAKPTILYTSIKRSGALFFLPVKLPSLVSKSNSWLESRMMAVEHAKKGWVRMESNEKDSVYDIFEVSCDIPDPEWPTDMDCDDMLDIAFKDRVIRKPDHPVIMKIRGKM